MDTDADDLTPRTPPPGGGQSLSPFESRALTHAVLWTTMIVAAMVLTVCWIFWI